MRTITLMPKNKQDYELLLKLAQRLGLEYREETRAAVETSAPRSLPAGSGRTREELLAIMQRGGDGKSIPDPLAWQREQRDDRDLPGRS